jgi:hypothetical protein
LLVSLREEIRDEEVHGFDVMAVLSLSATAEAASVGVKASVF